MKQDVSTYREQVSCFATNIKPNMKLTHTLLLCTTLLGSTAITKAADRKPFGNGTLPEFLKVYDVNNDGKLSVEERQAYEKAVRQAAKEKVKEHKLLWDTNGDGVVSDEERKAATEAMRKKIEDERAKRFDELDTNDDGKLSAAEFVRVPNLKEEIATRILAHLDTNKDGFISKDEFLNALKPPTGPRPPSGGGHDDDDKDKDDDQPPTPPTPPVPPVPPVPPTTP